MGRLVASQQRQIQEQKERLADDGARPTDRLAHDRAGAGIDLGIDAPRLDIAGAVLGDLGDAQKPGAPIGSERHDIAGLQGELARRQAEGSALTRGPGFEQPNIRYLRGLLGIEDERQIGKRNASAAARETPRLLDRGGVVTRV
jgi:hypothetical protein